MRLVSSLAISAALLVTACDATTSSSSPTATTTTATAAAPQITFDEAQLLTDLRILAADDMEGRGTGTAGSERARAYIISRLEEIGIEMIGDSYEHDFEYNGRRDPSATYNGTNVVGRIEGTSDSDRTMVLTAHYDHLGMRYGEIWNGADDNASGVSAMLEIAHALVQDTIAGNRPARSVIFVGFTAEEVGLRGSQYFVEHAPVDLTSISAVLNIDMVGRRDDRHRRDDPYIYMIGTRLHSQMLGDLVDASAENSDDLDVDFHFNSRRRQMAFYQRSDQWHFARYGVPALMAFAGTHPDYHTHRDVVDDIELDLLTPRVRYLTGLTRDLANAAEAMVRDRAVEE